MSQATVKIQLAGRVQGVNFRATCKSLAVQHGLRGYVQNMEDGTVEAVAQGEENDVRAFLQWLQRGSTFARVDSYAYSFLPDAPDFNDFEVKRSGNLLTDQIQAFSNLRKHWFPISKTEKPSVKMAPPDLLPKHLVIIPDGNRRWAKHRKIQPWQGHAAGAENFSNLAMATRELDIPYLTIWGFSTENWSRDSEEVKQLMRLVNAFLQKERPIFLRERTRFRHIGRRDRLPKNLLQAIELLESETADFNERQFTIAFDYGGRDELLRAAQKAQEKHGEISEETLASQLDTAGMPDPDLIIRTSGEQRLSGIMPWQAAYAELYFTPVHFPDFNVQELYAALHDFARRKRRFGS